MKTDLSQEGLLVLDMTCVKFRWAGPERSRLSAWTTAGELLAVVDVPRGTTAQVAAAHALDQVLAAGVVVRPEPEGNVRCRIALYDPFGASVAVGSLEQGQQVLRSQAPVALPAQGQVVRDARIGDEQLQVGQDVFVLDEDLEGRARALVRALSA